MTRLLIPLVRPDLRERAIRIIRDIAPFGTRVEIKGPRRSLPQNDRFWGMLTDISNQVPARLLDGTEIKITTLEWKRFFVRFLHREKPPQPKFVIMPDFEGAIDVSEDSSSSDLDVQEMSDCMQLMAAFGARHDVRWFFDGPTTIEGEYVEIEGELSSAA
jgi:NinB protein